MFRVAMSSAPGGSEDRNRVTRLRPDLLTGMCALGLIASGCDPGAFVRGVVIGSDGAPVAGANVSLICDAPTEPSDSAVTDRSGEFAFSELGCLGDRCRIEVRYDGNLASERVLPACVGTRAICGKQRCSVAQMTIRLR